MAHMEPLTRAVDPGSDRLTREQVVEIHKAHQRGAPWKQIAEDHGTTWKNVSRIVQGVRWRSIHPNVMPDLYLEARQDQHSAITEVLTALEEIDRQVSEIRAAVGQLAASH